MAGQQNGRLEPSDEELVEAFKNGSVDAFNRLVSRYKDPLMNFSSRYLGDRDEADDVVQETFVRVYRKIHTYKPVARFSTWIYTIATNLVKSHYRRRKRHPALSISQSVGGENQSEYEIPDNRYRPDAEAARSVRQSIIENALASLSHKYREIVILCDIEDLSYEEICSITGLNIGTVKSRLNRGRSQLQVLLKDILKDEDE